MIRRCQFLFGLELPSLNVTSVYKGPDEESEGAYKLRFRVAVCGNAERGECGSPKGGRCSVGTVRCGFAVPSAFSWSSL